MSSIIHSIFSKKKSEKGQIHMKSSGNVRYSFRQKDKDSTGSKLSRDLRRECAADEYENINNNYPRWPVQQRRQSKEINRSSEYGSAEPSPTHRVMFDDSSGESSECESDSDTEAMMAEFYEKKLKKDVKRYRKDAMFYYKFYKEYESVLSKYELMKHENQLALVIKRRRSSDNRVTEAVMGRRGAPEQLCSNDVLSDSSFMQNTTTSTISLDEMDEVKIFRKDNEDSEEEVEVARTVNVAMADYDYFVDTVEIPVHDDGYSTLNQEKVEPSTFDIECHSEFRTHYKSLRHSLSDSALHKPIATGNFTLQDTFMKGAQHYNIDRFSSACTSEDENMKVIQKQLKRRGDCVQYKGRRPDIVSAGRKLYKRFGTNERNALAQFEYLHDMSTDISGFITSPEPSTQ